jgi:hypothetical protein
MENINDIGLEQMKKQLSALKSKLDKETIVNDRLMRSIMNQKMKKINRERWIISSIILLGIPYCTWCFMFLLNMSVWFTVVTDVFMLVALIYTYLMHKDIKASELMKGNLIEVSRKMIKIKRMQANWLKFSIPFVVIWMAWFVIENLNGIDAKYVIIGGSVGAVIGAIFGTMSYRRTRRMATEVIQQIEELNEN